MSCEAAESVEDAIHDNRMFAERAFYCIANGAGGIPRTEFHACMRICPRDATNGAGSIPKTQSFLFIPKYSKIN